MSRAERRKAAQRGRAAQRQAQTPAAKRKAAAAAGAAAQRTLQTQFAFNESRVIVRFDGTLNQLFFTPPEARAWANNLLEAAKRVEDLQARIARGEGLPEGLQPPPPMPGHGRGNTDA